MLLVLGRIVAKELRSLRENAISLRTKLMKNYEGDIGKIAKK